MVSMVPCKEASRRAPRGLAAMVLETYIHIVIQFYPARAVQLYIFERLPDHIVWLSFRGLCCLDHGRFVNVTLVLDVQLAEGILQAKYVLLLELRVFPVYLQFSWSQLRSSIPETGKARVGQENTNFCILMTFMVKDLCCCEMR